MGKGDIRSRRGKTWRGTYGVSRPAKRKRQAPRPAQPSRKVKGLKDLPKAVSEAQPAAETVPVIETVQPVIEGVTAEVPQIVSEPVEEGTETEAGAKKTGAKKTTAAKKPAAKKPAAKKK